MISTTQTTTYNLSLTAEQFDDLYDVIEETIGQISEAIEDTDLNLNEYQIYHIWQQFNRIKEAN